MAKERFNAMNNSSDNSENRRDAGDIAADLQLGCDFPKQFSWSAYRSAPLYFPGGLSITNCSEEQAYSGLTVNISATPHYFVTKTWHIANIQPGHRLTLSGRELTFNEALLNSLSGAPLQATITYSLLQQNAGKEQTIAKGSSTVTLLAGNCWSGVANMGELLPVFVRPQDGTITRISSEAMIRARESKNVGYRHHSPAKIKELIEALFDVLDELSLNFANQKCDYHAGEHLIAAPNEIIRGQAVNSLDIALLVASLIECIDLHPLLLMYRQRALVGIWLKENLILDALTMTRPDVLRYQHRQGNLLVLDTRCLARRPTINFNQTLQGGAMGIESENDSDFLGAFDVHLARLNRIYPLGSDRALPEQNAEFDPEKTLPMLQARQVENKPLHALSRALPGLLNMTSANSSPADSEDAVSLAEESEDMLSRSIKAATRFASAQEQLQYNRSRLLNLTPANPLLNLQESNGAVNTILADSASLLHHFQAGKEVRPISLDMWHTTPESANFPPLSAPVDPAAAEAALENGHLFIDASEEDLHYSLRRLYHLVEYERQQTGVGSLYLVLNLVSWRQNSATYMAPFILLPLKLVLSETQMSWKIKPVSAQLWLNGNLIELLRQVYKLDVSLLGPQLQSCAQEGNFAKANQLLSEALQALPDAELHEDIVIGSFPLGRFQIWRDLERMTPALQSERLKNLIEPISDLNRTEVRSMGIINGIALEDQYPPSSLLAPWSCDSSQMEAIVKTEDGQDMVLLAPPGTGKNRTIADLICQRLGQGQKVLLVTKHRTTLNVVHRMLKKVGLSQFCLFMPSSRVSDDYMLGQLESAWQAKTSIFDRNTLLNEPYVKTHAFLTSLYKSLHQRRSNGLTVHNIISQALKEKEDKTPVFTLSWPNSDAHDEAALIDMRKLVDNLAQQKAKFSGPTSQVLRKIDHADWSAEWEKALKENLHTLCSVNNSLEASIEHLWDTLGCKLNTHTTANRKLTYELSQLLLHCAGHPMGFALESDASQRLNMLTRLAMHTEAYVQARAQLSCPYAPMAWQNLAGRRLLERWNEAQKTWWPKNIMAKKAIIKEILQGGAQREPNIPNDAPLLDRMCSEAQEIDELKNALRVPGLCPSYDTPSADILALESLGSRLRNFVASLSDIPELMVTLKSQLHSVFCEHAEWLFPEGKVGQHARECIDLWNALQNQQSILQELSGINLDAELRHSEDLGSELRTFCNNLLKQSEQWKNWCEWCQGRRHASEIGLSPLLQALDSGLISSEQALPQFQRAYNTWWLKAVIADDSILSEFNASDIADIYEKYRSFELNWRLITAQAVAGRISASIPDMSSPSLPPEWEELRSELQKTAGRKSAIQLWTEIPQVITALTPCLMMSPTTVSQLLSSHMEPFDLVILAESSQLSVEEGLCSYARAKQAVAVGDPQQMPPLFDSCSGIEESILDKFMQSGTAVRSLQQHYHSKEESLIAYANHRYYHNRICTFPAPVYGISDLKMALIDGAFNRLTRTNLAEAQAVVRAIVYRLTSDDPATRQQSIGVITFSLAQQQLIENMLAEEISANPDIAWAFDETQCPNPVIVRYLENSQGEYRDVVFLCVTYGWDDEGHFAMDFGPLNKTYGSKLLNVAITRSREETIVCANFRPKDIDLSRTQTPAIADLKEFLVFVESGYNEDKLAYRMEFPDDPLLSQIEEGLRTKGWEVHRQVGLSPLRIGLAVLHPDEANRYLACVIGDGYMYRDSRTTCERDLVRLKQLNRLGWNILRVWSLDWLRHPDAALERLHQALIKQLRNERAKPRR